MTRRHLDPATDPTLVLATHNAGKLREIEALVAPHGFAVTSAGALGLPEPIEDGTTFIENARIKALASARGSGKPALADDSGLAVDALHGAPGIFSARWAGAGKDFGLAMARVHEELDWRGAGEGAAARFICALTLAWPDGHCEDFEGLSMGSLTFPPRGERGFGYDPIFIPEGRDMTFAQIDPDEKNAMSHRAKAFAQLEAACLARTS